MAAVTTTVQSEIELGHAIPDAPHAVSVSLPSWRANVGYEEGEEWVASKMKNGYPRFFIHETIRSFATEITKKYGRVDEEAMLFPSPAVAKRCLDFLRRYSPRDTHHRVEPHNSESSRVIDLVLQHTDPGSKTTVGLKPIISTVLYPKSDFQVAKTFWQHSGDGVSSRRAEFCFKAFEQGYLAPRHDTKAAVTHVDRTCKGPRRYQRNDSLKDMAASGKSPSVLTLWRESPDLLIPHNLEGKGLVQFVEERFGRNLDMSLAANAKVAIRRRIAGSLTADVELLDALRTPGRPEAVREVHGFSEDDIYLYPTGMSSIFNTHQTLLEARGQMKSISFGFPYIDTLKVLEKWGPGCLFYGNGSSADLDDLESRCQGGERFLALFCEFPGNPLLKSPDLRRIRRLANEYDFAVVVDETIGNFMNVHVLPAADVMVSSLTKVFSGDSNVMGGSCIFNPRGKYYKQLRHTHAEGYEDNYWPEDAVFLERNSRDFVSRIDRINTNAEAICQVLKDSPYVKEVYYPQHSPSRPFYEQFRHPNGGYGGLLSVTFLSRDKAVTFFDTVEYAKGPSLGTNFTLCCPYVILAHYHELDWAAKFGVEADLIRVSVGLEDTAELVAKCRRALSLLEDPKPGC